MQVCQDLPIEEAAQAFQAVLLTILYPVSQAQNPKH